MGFVKWIFFLTLGCTKCMQSLVIITSQDDVKPSFRGCFFGIAHRIHGTGIFTYLPIYHKNQTNIWVNIAKYTMDGGSYWLVLASKRSHLPWDEIFGKCIDGDKHAWGVTSDCIPKILPSHSSSICFGQDCNSQFFHCTGCLIGILI